MCHRLCLRAHHNKQTWLQTTAVVEEVQSPLYSVCHGLCLAPHTALKFDRTASKDARQYAMWRFYPRWSKHSPVECSPKVHQNRFELTLQLEMLEDTHKILKELCEDAWSNTHVAYVSRTTYPKHVPSITACIVFSSS